MISNINIRTNYSATKEKNNYIAAYDYNSLKICTFPQQQVVHYHVSQNNFSTPFTMSKPVYSHERETTEIFLSTTEFIICLFTWCYFSQCLRYGTLNINSKKRHACHLLLRRQILLYLFPGVDSETVEYSSDSIIPIRLSHYVWYCTYEGLVF